MQMVETSRKRNTAGFSIIELLISTAIMLLIAIMAVIFWKSASDGFSLDSNIVTLKQQSERAMEIMTEGLREANAASILPNTVSSAIAFVSSSDGSNVQYSLAPPAPVAPVWGEIVQTKNGAQSVVAGYVETLQFTTSGTGMVTIAATFHKGAGRSDTSLTVQSSACPRN